MKRTTNEQHAFCENIQERFKPMLAEEMVDNYKNTCAHNKSAGSRISEVLLQWKDIECKIQHWYKQTTGSSASSVRYPLLSWGKRFVCHPEASFLLFKGTISRRMIPNRCPNEAWSRKVYKPDVAIKTNLWCHKPVHSTILTTFQDYVQQYQFRTLFKIHQ